MRRILFICSAIILCAATASAQKEKSWTEWTQQDAQKVLTNSAWGQTQTELSDAAPSSGTGGSAVTRAAENGNGANMVMGDAAKNAESGANIGQRNASLSVRYYVSFLSARPVRQAFIRMIELQRPNEPADKVAERRAFIDGDFSNYVVVTLRMDGNDKKKLAPAMQLLTSADAAAMKTTAYLERKDGKRVELMDYRPPSQDGMGAKFVFPRMVDGKPFLDGNSGELRVYIELGKTKLNRKFKVAEMIYDGKLEY
jgi:hypothetical protein